MPINPREITKREIDTDGMIDIEALQAVGVSGLNTYYNVTKKATYTYAYPGQFPQNKI